MSFVPKVFKGVNCRTIGLDNELVVLRIIHHQGWVREAELALLSGFGIDKVELVCRRLSSRNEISRERVHGDAGFFLRLKTTGADRIGGISGKDIEIPKKWRHDSVAIQSLHHLAHRINPPKKIITEAQLRREFGDSGKFSDGKLLELKLHFEQEWSKKSGRHLDVQANKIVELARQKTMCIIAYPYPSEFNEGIDHELRQANALRDRGGNGDTDYIRFLRCHFDSARDFSLARVSRFELISLPSATKTRAEGKRSGQKPVEKKRHEPHYYWRKTACREGGDMIELQLLRDEVVVETISFRRGYGGELHTATDGRGNVTDSSYPYDPYAPRKDFDDFVEEHKKNWIGEYEMAELAP